MNTLAVSRSIDRSSPVLFSSVRPAHIAYSGCVCHSNDDEGEEYLKWRPVVLEGFHRKYPDKSVADFDLHYEFAKQRTMAECEFRPNRTSEDKLALLKTIVINHHQNCCEDVGARFHRWRVYVLKALRSVSPGLPGNGFEDCYNEAWAIRLGSKRFDPAYSEGPFLAKVAIRYHSKLLGNRREPPEEVPSRPTSQDWFAVEAIRRCLWGHMTVGRHCLFTMRFVCWLEPPPGIDGIRVRQCQVAEDFVQNWDGPVPAPFADIAVCLRISTETARKGCARALADLRQYVITSTDSNRGNP